MSGLCSRQVRETGAQAAYLCLQGALDRVMQSSDHRPETTGRQTRVVSSSVDESDNEKRESRQFGSGRSAGNTKGIRTRKLSVWGFRFGVILNSIFGKYISPKTIQYHTCDYEVLAKGYTIIPLRRRGKKLPHVRRF